MFEIGDSNYHERVYRVQLEGRNLKNETKEIERRREDWQSLTKGIEDLAVLVGARFVADDEKLRTYKDTANIQDTKFAN